ncbi:MAG: hypothetical protein IJX16_05420, partial [Clostridia bacterium]|nr:hypothetical protein [Clostridia bacterium]
KHMQELLEIIEEPKNRNCFKSLLKTCELAEFLAGYLYHNGAIGENEKLNLLTRISDARKKVINEHKQFIKRMISENLLIVSSLGSLIDLIYVELFGA